MKGGFCVLRARGLLIYLVWAASGGEAKLSWQTFAAKLQEKAKQGLSFESGSLCPADTGASHLFSLGRLRRGQGGAGYGAAPPSRPPLHPPRSTPLGLSRFRHSARAARPLLRELPRCARRSPCAPRNASVRLRVEWEIREGVSVAVKVFYWCGGVSGMVICISMLDSIIYYEV